MGACATKPKVKTSDGTGREAPAPFPQLVKDEPATVAGGVVDAVVPDDHEGKEKKEVVVVSDEADEKKKVVQGDEDHDHGGPAAADDDKIKEVVDDEQASKRRSLSHLFKENEDGKDSTENNEKTPSDETATVKPEPLPSDSEYLTAGESDSTKVPEPTPEVKDSETVVEEIVPAAIEVNKSSSNAPEEKSKTEEVIEAAPADDHSETHDDKVTVILEKYREEKELEKQNTETAPASETTHDDKVKVILEKFREEEEEKTTVGVKENNQENAKV